MLERQESSASATKKSVVWEEMWQTEGPGEEMK